MIFTFMHISFGEVGPALLGSDLLAGQRSPAYAVHRYHADHSRDGRCKGASLPGRSLLDPAWTDGVVISEYNNSASQAGHYWRALQSDLAASRGHGRV